MGRPPREKGLVATRRRRLTSESEASELPSMLRKDRRRALGLVALELARAALPDDPSCPEDRPRGAAAQAQRANEVLAL